MLAKDFLTVGIFLVVGIVFVAIALGLSVSLIVLKRLPDAERDGNRIYAVIRGIGASSDGRSQSIYAPRVEGQAKALEAAYASAGIDPATVALIEAHGTGTRIGDKVEFQALCQVLGKTAGKANRCALGSVKSMIGHTKAAAGSAGLMKAALALHHKVLLPTLKADEPDPALNIADSPFYLSTRSRPWFAANDHPRRAGVSSFGFGGSNFHVVLEEYRSEKSQAAWDGSVQILAFSADDPQGLAAAITRFKALAETPLADAAFAQHSDQLSWNSREEQGYGAFSLDGESRCGSVIVWNGGRGRRKISLFHVARSHWAVPLPKAFLDTGTLLLVQFQRNTEEVGYRCRSLIIFGRSETSGYNRYRGASHRAPQRIGNEERIVSHR